MGRVFALVSTGLLARIYIDKLCEISDLGEWGGGLYWIKVDDPRYEDGSYDVVLDDDGLRFQRDRDV